MKKVIFYISMIVMLLVSCEHEVDNAVNDVQWYYITGFGRASVVVIDSCEYLIISNGVTHKGNCRFCRERLKNEN